METELLSSPILSISRTGIDPFLIVAGILFFILVFFVAVLSGAEVAFLSLKEAETDELKENPSGKNKLILYLLSKKDTLYGGLIIAKLICIITLSMVVGLAGYLLINNHLSVFIILISEIVILSLLIIVINENIVKKYAINKSLKYCKLFIFPVFFLIIFLLPLSSFIGIKSTIRKKIINKRTKLSLEEFSGLIDSEETDKTGDIGILKDILKFGNIDVKEIMRSRIDVIAIEIGTNPSELIKTIIDCGYTRLPVYAETFDNIKGILYTKDLLPFIHKENIENWQELIRPAYYVPESKKINILLKEFQKNKIHMAVVIDEYGGTSGIVTLEDILEEIVGEITDESDEDESIYSKLDENNYLFEGKILLNDFYKIVGVNDDVFDDIKGDSDTLAGLILKIQGEIPKANQLIHYKKFTFKIESVDKKRIKQIKVTIQPSGQDNKEKDS